MRWNPDLVRKAGDFIGPYSLDAILWAASGVGLLLGGGICRRDSRSPQGRTPCGRAIPADAKGILGAGRYTSINVTFQWPFIGS